MTTIKERILGAVTVMNDDDAQMVWELILTHFPKRSWDNIDTVTPDELDNQMIQDIATNPDCKEFVSADEACFQTLS
nr:MAG TPA: hypothetical protein [Caudoviricetes sp.]